MCYSGYMAYKDIVRGANGVRTRRVRQDDRTRERIRVAYLLNRLQNCVEGKVELTLVQYKAAELLLRKALPDLVALHMTGETTHNFCVAPEVLSEERWLKQVAENQRRQAMLARADTDPHAAATKDGPVIDQPLVDVPTVPDGKPN